MGRAERVDASGSACSSVSVASTRPSSLGSQRVPRAAPAAVPGPRPTGRTARHDPTLPTPRPHRCVQVLLAVLKHVHDGPHGQRRAPRPQAPGRRAQHLRSDRAAGPQAPLAFTPPRCGAKLLGQHSRDGQRSRSPPPGQARGPQHSRGRPGLRAGRGPPASPRAGPRRRACLQPACCGGDGGDSCFPWPGPAQASRGPE